jgi:hypothetical protein
MLSKKALLQDYRNRSLLPMKLSFSIYCVYVWYGSLINDYIARLLGMYSYMIFIYNTNIDFYCFYKIFRFVWCISYCQAFNHHQCFINIADVGKKTLQHEQAKQKNKQTNKQTKLPLLYNCIKLHVCSLSLTFHTMCTVTRRRNLSSDVKKRKPSEQTLTAEHHINLYSVFSFLLYKTTLVLVQYIYIKFSNL